MARRQRQYFPGKYHNKRTTVDGITFDSLKEAKRWKELSLMQHSGMIQDLQRQVKFVLIPAQREPDTIGKRGGVHKGKLLERECAYVADFVYKEKGETVVEDVKGYKDGAAYNIFTIKRKMVLFFYGIHIKEV
jgi:hypothetical protein